MTTTTSSLSAWGLQVRSSRANPELRGSDGPLDVGPASPIGDLFDACLAAAVECGHPHATDISCGLDVGFGAPDLNIADG